MPKQIWTHSCFFWGADGETGSSAGTWHLLSKAAGTLLKQGAAVTSRSNSLPCLRQVSLGRARCGYYSDSSWHRTWTGFSLEPLKCLTFHLLQECNLLFWERYTQNLMWFTWEQSSYFFSVICFCCYIHLFLKRKKKKALNMGRMLRPPGLYRGIWQRSSGAWTAQALASFEHLPKQCTGREPSCRSGEPFWSPRSHFSCWPP